MSDTPAEKPDNTPPVAPAHPPLDVRFLDEHIVAVSKPSGLLVHRDENHPDQPAALQVVRDQLGKYLYPVHRLDRATSGLLLYAFSSRTAAALQEQMSEPSAVKEYLLLTRWPGSFPEHGNEWVCEQPLHDEKDVARPARSEFALVEVLDRCALVRCRIRTGRYHQIRRHANHCGRHILGDTTHGKGRLNALYRERYGLERLFLHCHFLSLRHPVTEAPLQLDDPLPVELERVVSRLRTARDDRAAQQG